MFYLKDLGSLLDSIHEIDQDAIPMAMIKFTLPDGSTAKATYVHESMDGEVGSQGTIVLDSDDIHTEFDSMQYAIDGIEGLVRQRHMSSEPAESTEAEVPEADEEKVDYASLSADDLANEVDYYLRNNYPGANWVSDKELSDGSLALMIDWGNNNVEEIKPELKRQFGNRISFINTPPEAGGVGIIVNALESKPVNEAIDFEKDLSARYGDRITFTRTRSQYAPEQTASGILVSTPKAAQAVTESIDIGQFELVENFPIWAIEPLVNDSWGDYLQYNGEEIAREDFSDIDNFMTTHGYCGIHAPSDELYDQTHSEFTSHPAFGKSTDTCSVYAVKGPWKSLMKEYGLETEQDAESENYKEMTEDGVQGVLSKLGLTVVNKWYDGNRSRPVFDCKKDNGETICVWTEPPYEAKVWFKDREPGHNRYTEDIITLDSLEHELNALLDEMHEEELNAAAEKISAPDYHAEGAYEDLTDIGGDFEAVEFYKDIKTVCDIAGKPALAEAVIKLHKTYHPVLEAAEPKRHRIPRFVAEEANNIIAKNFGWSDELKAKEFDETWNWMERYADAFIPAWNKTDSVEAGIEAIYDAEEHQQCMYDGI